VLLNGEKKLGDNKKICFALAEETPALPEMAQAKSQSDAKQHSNMKDIKWGIVAFVCAGLARQKPASTFTFPCNANFSSLTSLTVIPSIILLTSPCHEM
jgi:hypothetical protein